ncbi:alpha/beta fold hydrolase [Rhizobium sp. L1K21]|nr:alpha/beta fold hydrolase [Rhizobium sp. L1K21]
MLKLFSFTALSLCLATQAYCSDAIGFLETLLGEDGARPLHVTIWYPTDAQTDAVAVGENAAFQGIAAIPEAKPTPGDRPLIVLSHGFGGSWRNLSWLAATLSHNGYIVAAPDHPGTTTRNRDPAQAQQLWERPHDLSRVIDAMTADPRLGGAVDLDRIAAIGHSLGGWTVSAIAGAHFDTQRFKAACQINSVPAVCHLAEELGLDNPALERPMGDPRVSAVVSLDLGGAQGFTPESLAAVKVPFLVVSAGTDIGDMPAKVESGYLAENLPKASSTYIDIPDAMHFSFMQLCKPGASALLDAEVPGDGIICRDGGTRSRAEIHDETASLITEFLKDAFAEKH